MDSLYIGSRRDGDADLFERQAVSETARTRFFAGKLTGLE
jgi:hypothetical protein